MGLPELKDYIESGKSNLKFVISGKMGVGKSSLINGLLGKKVAKEALSPFSITTEITAYKLQIEATDHAVTKKVEVLIMDCPGLGDPVNDEEANLTAISEHCRDADLLIYCIDMRGRFTTADATGMKEFNQRVGSDIWKNTVFVLTFANEVVLPSVPKPAGWLQRLTFGYFGTPDDSERKEKFKLLLKQWEEIVPRFLKDKVELPEELISDVCVIPAGYRNLPPPDRIDWFSDFWFAALSKIKEDARPALVGINLHRFRVSSPDSVRSTQQNVDNDELPINIVTAGKATGAVAVGTTGGAALGALIGGIVGTVGGPAGIAVGLYAGLLAGAGFGAAGGGTAGAAAGLAVIISAVRKHAKKAKEKIKEKAAEW